MPAIRGVVEAMQQRERPIPRDLLDPEHAPIARGGVGSIRGRVTAVIGFLVLTTSVVGADPPSRFWQPREDPGLLALAPNTDQNAETTQPAPRQVVSLTVDKTRYRHGERIAATIVNELAATIFAPPPGTGLCSVVGLERSETGTWTPAGTCPTEARAELITLGPRTVMTAALTSTASRAGPRDFASGPVPPSQSPEPSRPVPPSPRQDADLTPQYPEGIINVEGLLYPSVTGPLLPGIYRIVLTYTVGVPAGPIQQTRSPPFEVTR